MVTVNDDLAKEVIAANVTRLMSERKISCRALARMTGDTPMRISDLMNGSHVPSIGVVTRVAAALETSVDYLLAEPKKIAAAATRRAKVG